MSELLRVSFRMIGVAALSLVAGCGSIPPDAVVAFNRPICPEGWASYTPAEGAFVRGIDNGENSDPSRFKRLTTINGKTYLDPDGARKPGTVQDEDVGPHRHQILTGYQNSNSAGSGGPVWQGSGSTASQPNDGVETRPKNVALLYCIKK